MVYCRHCGAENDKDSTFCYKCGVTLSPANNRPPVSDQPSGIGLGVAIRRTHENLVIRCSVCDGQDFAKDVGRLDSRWGFTSFKVAMLTCKRCGHIDFFNKGRSIFDFD